MAWSILMLVCGFILGYLFKFVLEILNNIETGW